jgi:protein TonB
MPPLPEPDLNMTVSPEHRSPTVPAEVPSPPDSQRAAAAPSSASDDQHAISPEVYSPEHGKGQFASPRSAPRTARPLPNQALPEYPESAREDSLEGLVVLIADIGADGRVLAVRWAHRSGVPALDYSAREAVSHWRFQPATDGQAPVAGHAQISVRFSLLEAPVVAIAQGQR